MSSSLCAQSSVLKLASRVEKESCLSDDSDPSTPCSTLNRAPEAQSRRDSSEFVTADDHRKSIPIGGILELGSPVLKLFGGNLFNPLAVPDGVVSILKGDSLGEGRLSENASYRICSSGMQDSIEGDAIEDDVMKAQK